MPYTQTERKLSVTTALGEDVLLLRGMTAREGISRLYQIEVLALSENRVKVPFEALLGTKATVRMKMGGEQAEAFLDGICSAVSQGRRDEEFTTWRLTLVPALWLLTRRTRSRVFQQATVPEILRKALSGLDVTYELTGTYEPRDFCVQYRESDFAFVSRLMEEEGIFYFFRHGDGRHTMVVADSASSHFPVPGRSRIPYEELDGGLRDDERIWAWEKHQQMRSGRVTLWDHTFEVPHRHLEAEEPVLPSVPVGAVTHPLRVGGNDALELWDWPGQYAQRFDGVDPGGAERPADVQKVFSDARRTAKLRMEEETARAIVVRGASNARHLRPGHRFELERHFNANGPYVVVESSIEAEQSGDFRSGVAELRFSSSFACIPDALAYRPPRVTPKPLIAGTQTAVVVGPKGEEVFTDRFGRVKVQFHWDREGTSDERSSCWMRVAQLAAGRRWGTSFWPRVGQEVVVSFEEGDPDRPLVVGVVYNADQMPPYLGDGPDGAHRNDNEVSGFKSSTTPGGAGFNEWRFDDRRGREQVFVHAERDFDLAVGSDARESVGSAKHVTVGGVKDGRKWGEYREHVFRDKHVAVDGTLSARYSEARVLVGGEDGAGRLDLVVHGRAYVRVEKQSSWLFKKRRWTVVEEDDFTKVIRDASLQVDGTWRATFDQGELHSYHGLNVSATEICLEAGGSFIKIDASGVTIVGDVVRINSGGQATEAQAIKLGDTTPAREAEPRRPDPADGARSGQRSC